MSKRQTAINILKKEYERKAERHHQKAEKLNLKAANIKNEKESLQMRKNTVLNEIAELENKVKAIENSNKYLVSCKGKTFSIDKIINFMIYRNNRKIISLCEKIKGYKEKAERFEEQIITIESEIYSLLKMASVQLSKYDTLVQKHDSVDKTTETGIAGAVLTHLLLKENSESDTEKYLYKEISEAQLKLIESLDYDKRSSNKSNRIIIRFEKKYMKDFEEALSGAEG